jgi:hypothetical protein
VEKFFGWNTVNFVSHKFELFNHFPPIAEFIASCIHEEDSKENESHFGDECTLSVQNEVHGGLIEEQAEESKDCNDFPCSEVEFPFSHCGQE